MFYELTTLACPLLAVGQAAEAARAWVATVPWRHMSGPATGGGIAKATSCSTG